MERTTYELKYCERCGSLCLRPSQSSQTYCQPCGKLLLDYAFTGDRGLLLRKSKDESAAPLPSAGQPSAIEMCGRLQ